MKIHCNRIDGDASKDKVTHNMKGLLEMLKVKNVEAMDHGWMTLFGPFYSDQWSIFYFYNNCAYKYYSFKCQVVFILFYSSLGSFFFFFCKYIY
jgi:hypothetical protein